MRIRFENGTVIDLTDADERLVEMVESYIEVRLAPLVTLPKTDEDLTIALKDARDAAERAWVVVGEVVAGVGGQVLVTPEVKEAASRKTLKSATIPDGQWKGATRWYLEPSWRSQG